MASNKLETDEDDQLMSLIDYQAENYTVEELVIENDMLKKSTERKRQQLKDKHKRINERLKKEEEELNNQLRIADKTELLSSETTVKVLCSEQNQEENAGLQFASIHWTSAETIISHSENSDFYIEVNSCTNTSRWPSLISNTYESIDSAAYTSVRPGKYIQNANKRSGAKGRQVQEAETIIPHSEDSDFYIEVSSGGNTNRNPSLISDTYENVGSAAYASVRPGKYIQNANKRGCVSVRQVLFTLLALCLSSTALIVLNWKLSGSDDAAITPIKPPCILCNSTEVNEVNGNKTCCDRNPNDMLPEGRMIRSHFISYVDGAFLKEKFPVFSAHPNSRTRCSVMALTEHRMAELLIRGYPMVKCEEDFEQSGPEAGPMSLKFFKEQLDDGVHGRLFDFNETTGEFYVKYSGLYSVYANIISYNTWRHLKQPTFLGFHKRRDGKIFSYRLDSNNLGILAFYKQLNQVNNYMHETIYMYKGESFELRSIYKHTVIDLTYSASYFGGSLLFQTIVE